MENGPHTCSYGFGYFDRDFSHSTDLWVTPPGLWAGAAQLSTTQVRVIHGSISFLDSNQSTPRAPRWPPVPSPDQGGQLYGKRARPVVSLSQVEAKGPAFHHPDFRP